MRLLLISCLLFVASMAQTASTPPSRSNVYRPPPGCLRIPISGDCEGLTQRCCVSPPNQPPGSKVCLWDADELECIESMPGDPEHVCAQFSDPGKCRQNPMCVWDLTEYKCVQFSDADLNFPVFPPRGGPSMRGNSGGAPPPRPSYPSFFPPRAPMSPFYPQMNPFMPIYPRNNFNNADSTRPKDVVGGSGGVGPAWTYDNSIEPPAGKKNMGGWMANVYTSEQQERLGVDENGVPTNGNNNPVPADMNGVKPQHHSWNPPMHGHFPQPMDGGDGPVYPRIQFPSAVTGPDEGQSIQVVTYGTSDSGGIDAVPTPESPSADSGVAEESVDTGASASADSTSSEASSATVVDSSAEEQPSSAESAPSENAEPAAPAAAGGDTGRRPPFPPRPPMPPPDCEMLLTPNTCNGKMHEGKACYWDFERRECIESVPGDPEHLCASLGSPSDCNSNVMCRWQTYRCVQLSDYEPPFPAFMPPMFPPRPPPRGPSNARPSASNAPAFTPPSNDRPSQPSPSRPSFPHRPSHFMPPQLDCEHYLTPTQCNGKMHEGRQCSWSVSRYECIDIEFGDTEHICDSFASPQQCAAHSRICGYDMSERRCVQISDLDVPNFPQMPWRNMANMFGPGKRLKSAHCALHLEQSECKSDLNCNWDLANTRCHTLHTQSPMGTSDSESYNYNSEALPSRPSALLLFLISFISTLVGICAYHLIVRARERWHRKKEVRDDFYYQVTTQSHLISVNKKTRSHFCRY